MNVPLNTIVAAINGNLDDDNIKSGANINGTKLLAGSIPGTAFDATTAGGWITTTLAAPNTVTNNGNRSVDLVFNSVDYTQEISPGMRLKATRTVTAPTQCTDLEASSSQYFSKTTPAGMTFTDDFTCMGWVKLESYATGGIIARRNADTEGWDLGVANDGRLEVFALRIAANNSQTLSYQSLPLNKWVHVAATVDLSGTSVLMYIDGVLVPSATTITGTITALVQGTTALVVGARKSAGTEPFDGKIAQAAVFSAVLTAATIRSYMNQTLTGSETSLISAYSFNNSIADLNTTNANNLTANGGALATNVDSPFAGGVNASTAYTAGTTEYAEVVSIAFSTNTTMVVRVPDGYALPTSGGISALSYSTQNYPLGWPGISNILAHSILQSNFQTTSTTDVQVTGLTATVTIPPGRTVRLSFSSQNIYTGTVNVRASVNLWDGTVGSGTKLSEGHGFYTGTGSATSVGFTQAILSASGTKTFNVGFRAQSAATANLECLVGSPAILSVELV